MGDDKDAVSSRRNRADVHMNSQKLQQHLQDLSKHKPHGVPALRESGHGTSP